MLKRLTRSNTTTSPDKIHVFKPGSYVWAKMDRKFWPGIIVSHRDIGMETAETGKCWVFWFGDHRVSNVSCKILKDFCQEYFRYITIPEMYCKKWVQGIAECLREIGLPDTQTLSIPDLKTWAKSNLENAYLTKYFVTNFVKSKLDKIRSENLKPANDEYDTFTSRCIPSMESTMETEFSVALPVEVSNLEDNIDSVKECANHIVRQIIADYNMGKISTLRICMGCYSDKISDEHPIFNGYFCTDCNKRFKKTYCKIVPNLKKEYCTVCGFAGDMLVCMNIKCKFVYCTICIQDLAEVDAYAVLSKKKKWFCFLCAPNRTCRGVLVPRDGWEDNENMIVPTQKQVLFSNKYSNQSSAFKDKEKKERRSSNIKLILSIIETFKNKSGFHYSGNSNECIEITKKCYAYKCVNMRPKI
ncbi:DNA (cytosine-5)-methyltransferase 3B-like isoform X2 [Onthophagus taurus]|uniref:DNA (cytosine-5)-methyltransferase 3B-like isoform X2 n=1 Tax=Onthophagus taurus TaxID=166361 RepID=UPI000C2045D6|nr:DNA (cytosine-5)-methyltransferase 3B-like isoform X2 [Onthophagus taurus]